MRNCCNNNEMFFCLCSDLSCSQSKLNLLVFRIRLVWFIVGSKVRGSSGRFSWYQSFGLQSSRTRHIRTEWKNSSEIGLETSYKNDSLEIGLIFNNTLEWVRRVLFLKNKLSFEIFELIIRIWVFYFKLILDYRVLGDLE